jgi:hypothetical protein
MIFAEFIAAVLMRDPFLVTLGCERIPLQLQE